MFEQKNSFHASELQEKLCHLPLSGATANGLFVSSENFSNGYRPKSSVTGFRAG